MIRSDGMLKLLLVDDSLTEADNVINALRSTGHAVRASREENISGIEQAITSQTWDMIICRAGFTAVPPRELVNFVHRLGRDIPCIVLVSDQDNIESLYELNVQDIVYISDVPRLQFAVQRELNNLFNRRAARRNERALRESEKRSRLLLESSKDAVAYMHEGMHIYVNSAYLNLFGYEEAEDVDGLPILDLIASDDQQQFKLVFRQFSEQSESQPVYVSVQCVREDSTMFNADIEFSHAEVEGERCTQVVVRDTSKHQTADNEQLQLLRDHDFLTGLYNRVRFLDELESITSRAAENKGDASLLYIVLNEFQHIKEQIGVANSELVLKELGEALRKGVVEGDLLAHYADQVFAVIIDSDDDDYVDQRAQTYLALVDSFTTQISDKPIDLKCCVGVSRISETNFHVDSVLNQADKACMQAQQLGDSDSHIMRYQDVELEHDDGELDETAIWRAKLEHAVEKEQFSLHYQPIVSLHGREQELYEVLLRLTDDNDDNLIMAGKFIAYTTEFGMMDKIDKWVISHAFETLKSHQERHPKTRFFIKLSNQTICDNDFVDWLDDALTTHQVDAASLTFEVSETDALTHIEATKSTIDKLRSRGCEFGLEHFGSGIDFSSSLDELDVDYVKINGTFVQNMAHDSENQAAVKAIIEMSKEAGKQSIAEFVSDANSLALLWRLGVDYAQGYYIHEPSAELNYNFEDDDL